MRRTRLGSGLLTMLAAVALPTALLAQLAPPPSMPVPAAPAPAAPVPVAPAPAVPTEPAAPATPTPPIAPRPVYPYTGYVSGDLVNIRCGPGLYYYPLKAMNKDAQVVVEAETNGWLALRPPEGVHGLVRKGDVTKGADGSTATVSAAGARVYASSPTAKRQWCVMAVLPPGDTVRILGEDAEHYRVTPPEAARVYVVDQYVAAAAAGQPGVTPRVVGTDIEPPKADPLVEAYKEADAELRAQLVKEVSERDYEAVAAKFKEIAEKAEKAFLKDAAAKRVAQITALQEEQADYKRVIGLSDQLDQRLADIKGRRAEEVAASEREKHLERADFVAKGLLAHMESLQEVDYPIKFKLVDQNNRPLVVLKSDTYDLAKYLGKVVGVRGTKTYLKEWRIYLVNVDDLEVLEE